MTEQIKSAIEELKIADEYCVIPSIKSRTLAIRSLNAWEEVLNQLHEWKNNAENEHEQKIAYAYFSAIDIINQHLAEIEE